MTLWTEFTILIKIHIQCQPNSGILCALSADESDSSKFLQDQASGELPNNRNKSQVKVEFESVDWGELEAKLPPTLNVPMLLSFNLTESDAVNAPGLVLTANAEL